MPSLGQIQASGRGAAQLLMYVRPELQGKYARFEPSMEWARSYRSELVAKRRRQVIK